MQRWTRVRFSSITAVTLLQRCTGCQRCVARSCYLPQPTRHVAVRFSIVAS